MMDNNNISEESPGKLTEKINKISLNLRTDIT